MTIRTTIYGKEYTIDLHTHTDGSNPTLDIFVDDVWAGDGTWIPDSQIDNCTAVFSADSAESDDIYHELDLAIIDAGY